MSQYVNIFMQQVDTKPADLPNAQQDVIEAEKKNPPPLQPETTAQDLQATTKKRQKLAEELQTVEKQVCASKGRSRWNFCMSFHQSQCVACLQIFELETRYLENSHPLGSAIKGMILGTMGGVLMTSSMGVHAHKNLSFNLAQMLLSIATHDTEVLAFAEAS